MNIKKLKRLQARLNFVFVKWRDAGLPVASIYAQLKIVEHKLSAMRVMW